MEIRPLNAAHQIGAEVYGIELNGDLAENALLELQNAWKKHKVLIFPNQTFPTWSFHPRGVFLKPSSSETIGQTTPKQCGAGSKNFARRKTP
ncbi:hypothetical protein [Burkholderia cenocepacia]|uniref:hypothetical protein n=1 Tax=Burkholderia cenocepacia TaxID=95486 RepID=UPI001FC7BD0C|nr:hypothetical protein [Burkholderia cenocepacia]